jgi:phosphate uptake regulator
MIALQQPVSHDLRTIITVLKASSDLERMGDHAVSIAKATISLKGEERIHVVEEDISLMGERVKSIVDAALNATFKVMLSARAKSLIGMTQLTKCMVKFKTRHYQLWKKIKKRLQQVKTIC